MRQVPRYLIIGNGRVARHFSHYFSLLSIPYSLWHRSQSLSLLHQEIQQASHILLLINDQNIEPFFINHLKNTNAYCLHFSGSLASDLIYGTHPLMTFGHDLYSLEKYQSIPFVIDYDAPANDIILPGLPNPSERLDKKWKAKYHALCVLAGNFSCILWQKLFSNLQSEFNLSPSIAYPYFMQQNQNLLSNSKTALTGPLVRKDLKTIEKNINALEGDPFQEIYTSFISCYQKLQKESE